MNVVDSVMIRRQQSFEKYNQLNPIEIKIEDDKVIHILKMVKNATYHFIPVGLLFSSGIQIKQ